MTLISSRSISASVAYSVVVLPDPVGPAQITIPYGDRMSRSYSA